MGSTYASRNAASREVSFYNYKKYLSIILLAMVDAHLRFTYMDVGAEGKQSELFEGLQQNTLKKPVAEPLEGDNIDMPYFVIGDGAFAENP